MRYHEFLKIQFQLFYTLPVDCPKPSWYQHVSFTKYFLLMLFFSKKKDQTYHVLNVFFSCLFSFFTKVKKNFNFVYGNFFSKLKALLTEKKVLSSKKHVGNLVTKFIKHALTHMQPQISMIGGGLNFVTSFQSLLLYF